MLSRLKLAPRLAISILIGTGAVLTAVIVSDHLAARRLLEDELRSRARHLALATAREMEVIKRAVEKVVHQVKVSLDTQPLSAEGIYRLLENTLKEHGELFGTAVALDPLLGASPPDLPFVHRSEGGSVRKNLADGDYRYEVFDWYQLPRELREPVWSEPYYDDGGGDAILVTYSVPVLSAGGGVAGVITGDLSLEWLTGLLGRLELGDGGLAMVISRNGTVVSHPETSLIMRESIFSLAEAYGNEEARKVGRSMVRGESGFVEFRGFRDPRDYWMAYAPVPDTGWCLGALFPQEEITSKLITLSRGSALLGGLGALAMVAVALWIAHAISRPLRELGAATRVLAAGDLGAALPAPRGKDEVAELAASFAAMRDDLRRHIEELKAATAERARIEGELDAARKIQLDILPRRFDLDPPREEARLHAILEPARQVGGDFYDFFMVPDGRLFLAVGDVSGKGVAAALFMALSKATLKAFVSQGLGPGEALVRLNDELAAENEEGMFLTVFCAAVDLGTGEVSYAMGGHDAPLVLLASGEVEALPRVRGPLIGLDAGRSFEPGRFVLERGDLLVVTSDGVVEAEDPAKALFGEERLREVLARQRGQPVEDALAAVREEVLRFASGAPQSDDITLLGLQFRGGDPFR